ncbi:GNAT family N-acetyltransferase [Paraglaciecola aestuariivivens]
MFTAIRLAKVSDIPFIKQIIEQNQMFPAEMLDPMIAPFLHQQSEELWFVVEADKPIGLAYCAPERMTEGTWNMLLIAIDTEYQGQNIGATLMAYAEQVIAQQNARVLLVETSGLAEYARTRAFYPKCGYKQVARIPDYYAEGDDKVVFWKRL